MLRGDPSASLRMTERTEEENRFAEILRLQQLPLRMTEGDDGGDGGREEGNLTFRTVCVGFREGGFEIEIGAADFVDYAFCPVEVFLFSL